MAGEDRPHLERCIELATEALEAGDAPFGSVLVDAAGNRPAKARVRYTGGLNTR